MTVTLWEVESNHLVRHIERCVYSKKVFEDFWDVHFFGVSVKGRVVDSNTNGFS